MQGRLVPWASWQEWNAVREQLHSTQVDIWRARGRLPLGVDSTAALLDIRLRCVLQLHSRLPHPPRHFLRDPMFVQHTNTLPTTLLRAQYSIVLLRLVNGVADQAQRGRVAGSVANLAAAAGLPRMLVDMRHEATHNELPQLPALHVAVDAALAWLAASYWSAQVKALADGAEAVTNAVHALVAAAGRRQTPGGAQLEEDPDAPQDAWRGAVKAVKVVAPAFATEAVADALLQCEGLQSPGHVEDAATQLAKHWPALPARLMSALVQRACGGQDAPWRVWWKWLVVRKDVSDDALYSVLRQLLQSHAAAPVQYPGFSSPLAAMHALAAVLTAQRPMADNRTLAGLCTLARTLTTPVASQPEVDTSERAVEALEDGLQRAEGLLAALQRQRGRSGTRGAAAVRVDHWQVCAIGAMPPCTTT